MLTISQVSKAFAGRTLFEDASLQVNRGDRVGLVGPNGAGKSTLFSLILGEASPDEGKVSLEKSATIGFLPQEHAPAGEETVLELACGKVAHASTSGLNEERKLGSSGCVLTIISIGRLSRRPNAFWRVWRFANRISIGRRRL